MNMKKKLIISLLSLTFVFSLGVIGVKANEEATGTPTNIQGTTMLLKQRKHPTLIKTQIKRKKNIREIYENRLNELKEKYYKRKGRINRMRATTTANFKSLMEKREAQMQRIKERRDLIQKRMGAQRKIRVKARSERVIVIFDKTIERLETLEQKISNRIDLLESKGFDMATPRKLMPLVPKTIQNAKNKIGEMKDELRSILNSDNPGKTYEKALVLAYSAKDAVKTTLRSLIDVVRSIGESVKATKREKAMSPIATTTNQVSSATSQN